MLRIVPENENFAAVYRRSIDIHERLLRVARNAGHFAYFFRGPRKIAYLIQDIMTGVPIESTELLKQLDFITDEIHKLRNSPYFLEGSEERRGVAAFIGCVCCVVLYEKTGQGSKKELDIQLWFQTLAIIEDRILLQEIIESLD